MFLRRKVDFLLLCHNCVGRTFDSFSDVEAFLESLKKQSHPLRVCNSQTSTNYKKHNGDGVVDEEKFEYTYYSVRCVHFGKPRHRGKGIRPNQHAFPMECFAKVTVSYDRYVFVSTAL